MSATCATAVICSLIAARSADAAGRPPTDPTLNVAPAVRAQVNRRILVSALKAVPPSGLIALRNTPLPARLRRMERSLAGWLTRYGGQAAHQLLGVRADSIGRDLYAALEADGPLAYSVAIRPASDAIAQYGVMQGERFRRYTASDGRNGIAETRTAIIDARGGQRLLLQRVRPLDEFRTATTVQRAFPLPPGTTTLPSGVSAGSESWVVITSSVINQYGDAASGRRQATPQAATQYDLYSFAGSGPQRRRVHQRLTAAADLAWLEPLGRRVEQ